MRAHLLIAEDSLTQREVLRATLEDAGYDVDAARDGRAAVERLSAQEYAMLISDIVMPQMDGYAVCREAKRLHPRLPVLLLTSMNDPLDVVHGLQAGADGFMRKPYDQSQLLNRIDIMLRNRELREAGQSREELELLFLDQRFMITADRQQILDLLVSTFEDLVHSNERLRQEEAALTSVWEALTAQLAESQSQRRRLSAILHAVPQAVAVVDADGRVTAGTGMYARLVGAEELVALEGASGEPLRLVWQDGDALDVQDRPALRAMREGRVVRIGDEARLLAERADGSRVPVRVVAAPVPDDAGELTSAVEIVQEREPDSL